MAKIEIEKCVFLGREGYDKLLTYLNEHAKKTAEREQMTIFSQFNNPHLGEMENTKASVAISYSRDVPTGEFSCHVKGKFGNFQATSRKEISFKFQYEDTDDILHFLPIFGVTTGCPRYYHRTDFTLEGIDIAIKRDGLIPDHAEFEIEVDNKSELPEAEKKIDELLKKLGLIPAGNDEYKEIILKCFNDYPPINLVDVDVTEYFT